MGCYIWYSEEGPQSPPRCTKCNSPPINGQCTNFISFGVVLLLPLHSQGLIECRFGLRGKTVHLTLTCGDLLFLVTRSTNEICDTRERSNGGFFPDSMPADRPGTWICCEKNRENIRNGFRIFLKVLYTTLFHHKYGTVVEKQAINKIRKIHLTIIHVL